MKYIHKHQQKMLLSIDDNNKVNVPIDKLKQSCLFSDIIDMFGTDQDCQSDQIVIPFPPSYKDVSSVYLDYLSDNGLKITNNDDSIKLSIELAHYLLDDKFFETLLPYLLKLEPTRSKKLIRSLSEFIQRSLCLYLPLSFVPPEYRHKIGFVNEWLAKNKSKSIPVGNKAHITKATYTDNNNNILSTVDTFVTDKVERTVFKHGVCQQWNSVTEDGKQYPANEYTYRNNGKAGPQYQWYPNGKLYQKTYIRVSDKDYSNDYHRRHYNNGNIMFENFYQDKVKVGTWRYWYESGRLKCEIPYCGGVKHGTMKGYYDTEDVNCNCEYEYHFNYGKECGIFREWYCLTSSKDSKQQMRYEHIFPESKLNKNHHRQWSEDGKLVYQSLSPHIDLIPQQGRVKKPVFNGDTYRSFNCLYIDIPRYNLV
jgi:antitoxin component YwqK of YwqJK toxin-antitoxin module